MSRPIILRNCTVKFLDGAGTPAELTLYIDDGNVQVTTANQYNRRMNRGKVAGGFVTKGDDVPMELSINARFLGFKSIGAGAANLSIQEFLDGGDGTTTLVSTADEECEAFCVDVEIEEGADPDCPAIPAVNPELAIYPKFRAESLQVDYKTGMINLSGFCFATRPTATRP